MKRCFAWRVGLAAVVVVVAVARRRSVVRAEQTTAPPDNDEVPNLPLCPVLQSPGLVPPINRERQRGQESEQREPWDELNHEEIQFVRNFVSTELNLMQINPNPWTDNYVFQIMVQEPSKESMLAYLHGNGGGSGGVFGDMSNNNAVRPSPPPRYARATVAFGSEGHLMEYLVGPLEFPDLDPHNTTLNENVTVSPLTKPGELPLRLKNVGFAEFLYLDDYIGRFWSRYNKFLQRAFDSPFEGSFSCGSFQRSCAGTTLQWIPHLTGTSRRAPAGYRISWMRSSAFLDNDFSYPLPFQFWVDTRAGANVDAWEVREIVYQDQFFATVQDLDNALQAGTIRYVPLEPFESNPFWQTLQRRTSHPRRGSMNDMAAPSNVSPNFRFLFTNQRWVDWMGWSFYVKNRLRTGMALFDVRFLGEPYAYEISLQELFAGYSGLGPHLAQQQIFDSFFHLGSASQSGGLVPGVDCPAEATYFAEGFFCLFEMDVGRPLWRHNRNTARPHLYAGAKNTILVLRAIYTVGNYDYLVEVHFQLDGQIHVAFSASGNVWLGAYSPKEELFGTRIHKEMFAPLHTHFGGFKVDLDVVDADQNCVEKTTVRFKNRQTIPGLFPDDDEEEEPDWSVPNKSMFLKRRLVPTERSAKVVHHNRKPAEWKVVSCDETNAWGYRRGLEIVQHNTPIALPRHPRFANYHMLFTQRKEQEPFLTGPYDGQSRNEPFVPLVDNDHDDDAPQKSENAAMSNGESLLHQDIVAWVNVGFYHVPRAEDVPVTNVVETGFTIRPSNYYEENPSMDLAQSARRNNGQITDDLIPAQCLYTL